jgi:hypothetical protein
MAVSDVDGHVLGHQALGRELIHRVVVGLFHAERNRGIRFLGAHLPHEGHVVEVEAVHHIEVTVLRQPQADLLVHHGFHVGRHYRDAEGAPAQLDAGVAFRAAFHAALARQKQHFVVIEDFHTKLQRAVVDK